MPKYNIPLIESLMQYSEYIVFISGAVAFLVVFMIGRSYIERDILIKRLKSLEDRRKELRGEVMGPKKRERHARQDTFIRTVVNKLNLLQDTRIQIVKQMLISSGDRSPEAIYKYAFLKFVMPFALMILGWFALKMGIDDVLKPGWKLISVIAAGYGGLKLPDILLVNRRSKRWYKVRQGISDALDLMMVCAEAGLTLGAAIDRVSKELRLAYPELAEELAFTSIEMGFMPERRRALENLQKRVDIAEVRSIVSVLLQTEKYGTPVSQALRALASDFRAERMLRAEQKAARLPAIMTVPMILFILPTLFIILMAPAMINLIDVMSKR